MCAYAETTTGKSTGCSLVGRDGYFETARCAVETMGAIAVEQGFYSADGGEPAAPAYSGSSECLAIADPEPGEVWIFNVLTGKGNASAIWAAQRIPSDHVAPIGNSFTIRKMKLDDPENFRYSPGITSLAEEMGWWSPKQEASCCLQLQAWTARCSFGTPRDST